MFGTTKKCTVVGTILAMAMGKQGCNNMNKIWAILMISMLMTNHHANQLVCDLKWQIGGEKQEAVNHPPVADKPKAEGISGGRKYYFSI